MLTTKCPHCKSNMAWYAEIEMDWYQRCLCGLARIVYSHLYGPIVEPEKPKIRVPRKGTTLMKCLEVVAKHHPRMVSTGGVARELSSPSSKIATFLSVLSSKGLLEKAKEARGVSGGSSWQLTDAAILELGME